MLSPFQDNHLNLSFLRSKGTIPEPHSKTVIKLLQKLLTATPNYSENHRNDPHPTMSTDNDENTTKNVMRRGTTRRKKIASISELSA